MIETKTFEVRDRATTMPVLAVRVAGAHPALSSDRAGRLLTRAGFGEDPLVILIPLEGACGHTWQYSPHDWPTQARTIPEAHRYIQACWDELRDGAVVDMEFVLGETPRPKESEV